MKQGKDLVPSKKSWTSSGLHLILKTLLNSKGRFGYTGYYGIALKLCQANRFPHPWLTIELSVTKITVSKSKKLLQAKTNHWINPLPVASCKPLFVKSTLEINKHDHPQLKLFKTHLQAPARQPNVVIGIRPDSGTMVANNPMLFPYLANKSSNFGNSRLAKHLTRGCLDFDMLGRGSKTWRINMVVDHGRKQQKPYNKLKKKDHKKNLKRNSFTTKTRIRISPQVEVNIRNFVEATMQPLCFTSFFPNKKIVPRIRSTRWQLFTPSFAACIGAPFLWQ